MNALVTEYRSLPQGVRAASDPAVELRKTGILKQLDDDANEAEVSGLLLDLLRDPAEVVAARAEAIEVVGLYIDETSPLWRELFREVLRIHGDAAEAAAVRDAAEPYAVFFTETLGG